MTSWADVTTRLREDLAGLEDGGFVVVGDPPAEQPPPQGLLRRRPPPPPTRFAQAARRFDHLYAECVGATSFGGDWPVTAEQHERLRAAGWLAPGDHDETQSQPAYPCFWRTLPATRTDQVADLLVTALQVLGLDPADLDWRLDS